MPGFLHPKFIVIVCNGLAGLVFLTNCIPQVTPMPTPTATLQPSPTPGLNTITADLLNQVYRLQNFMPLEDDGYLVPTKTQQSAFSEIVSKLESGELISASDLAEGYNFDLVRYLDLGDEKAASYLLREQVPISRGWGLYMFRAGAVTNIIVEAPHPLADKMSDIVALDIYRALDARALLIAGAHRAADPEGVADVAHTPESIFHSIHETLVQKTTAFPDTPVVLQIHGFAADKHPGYPRVILGFGQSASREETLLSRDLIDAFNALGIDAGICEGDSWQDLCGTKNIQGSDKENVIFIHIELDETIRADDQTLVAAFKQVFAKRKPLAP